MANDFPISHLNGYYPTLRDDRIAKSMAERADKASPAPNGKVSSDKLRAFALRLEASTDVLEKADAKSFRAFADRLDTRAPKAGGIVLGAMKHGAAKLFEKLSDALTPDNVV